MLWQPEQQKLDRMVLEAGDEYATHSGGKGGLHIGSPQVSQDEEEPAFPKELRAALDEVLEGIDFDD